MAIKSTIVSSTFPNSSPRLSRSSITNSTLCNLTHADSIKRSVLSNVSITNDPSPPNPTITATPDPTTPTESTEPQAQKPPTTLTRCKITTSSLSHTRVKKSTITHSTLSNIRSARSLDAKNSTLENVSSLRRVKVTNTTVTAGSALSRVQATDSVVSGSAVYRSQLEGSRVFGSRVKKSRLRDCEMRNCVLVDTEFRGMVLRNGVWRRGRLVGSLPLAGVDGDGEVVVMRRDGKKMDVAVEGEVDPERWMQGLASETESTDWDDSESDEDKDLPPAYTP
ncbi:hypothetical protein BJX61DRAFT_547716 [Aspergillus egyptiacus]|nr:hypothetical protein BJX61DRAFT_547716 [Aspergillus egyptiacus]